MASPYVASPSRRLLIIEFLLICVLLPTIIIYFRLAPYMFGFLWCTAALTFILYRLTPATKGVAVWRFSEVNKRNLNPILLRFIIASALLLALVYVFVPEKAFSLPRERPDIWWKVMTLYPLLSAVPQEFIFCTYFFARYQSLFKNQTMLLWVGSAVFAYAHVLYINPVAPVLSLAAGYFFAQTYMKTRSLALVSLEHALYGNMIFTIGLGSYFFAGR